MRGRASTEGVVPENDEIHSVLVHVVVLLQ